jgi:hypothetical protein
VSVALSPVDHVEELSLAISAMVEGSAVSTAHCTKFELACAVLVAVAQHKDTKSVTSSVVALASATAVMDRGTAFGVNCTRKDANPFAMSSALHESAAQNWLQGENMALRLGMLIPTQPAVADCRLTTQVSVVFVAESRHTNEILPTVLVVDTSSRSTIKPETLTTLQVTELSAT